MTLDALQAAWEAWERRPGSRDTAERFEAECAALAGSLTASTSVVRRMMMDLRRGSSIEAAVAEIRGLTGAGT